MIHTIVPIEVVLKDHVKDKIDPYMELSIKGISCYVEKLSEFEYKIVRVLSSDPSTYLNSSLQPGSVINLKNNF